MAENNNWIAWALGGLVALVLGYGYITSQKAGANNEESATTTEPKKAGCGCGMEKTSKY